MKEGPRQSVRRATRRVWPAHAVPGFERRAEGSAGIAGHRLHEYVVKPRVIFQGGDQQRVEAQAAGQAHIVGRRPPCG